MKRYSPKRIFFQVVINFYTLQTFNQSGVNAFLSDNGILRLDALSQSAFAVIEKEWKSLNVSLVDLKFEFGLNIFGNVKIADVISNDEWRIWPGGDKSQMKDKEVYRKYCREGKITPATLAEISNNYRWVAEQTAKFLK